MASEVNAISVECVFLDVAQATSNVIYLGDGKAIIIDCGGVSTLLRFLRRHVTQIEVLIISHNHSDHDAGAARILQAFPKRVKKMLFLDDGMGSKCKSLKVALAELEAGNLLNPPERLEASDKPTNLYSDPTRNIWLGVYYPTFTDTLIAGKEINQHARANRTSAILGLFCDNHSVIFGSDATFHAWEAIYQRIGSRLPCHVLVTPHHGGAISTRLSNESAPDWKLRLDKDSRVLYSDMLKVGVGVISAGTSNPHGHPHPITIRALTDSGATVMCTQITSECVHDLESIRPGVLTPNSPCRSTGQHDCTQAGRSRNVACASTVIVHIGTNLLKIERFEEHQKSIDNMVDREGLSPLCRLKTLG